MAGVWVFRNGVAKLVQNPLVEPIDGSETSGPIMRGGWGGSSTNCKAGGGGGGLTTTTTRKALVHVATGEVIGSYEELEEKLVALGWVRYYGGGNYVQGEVLQFHRSSASSLLITLPSDFTNFKTMHMYDIVLKNRHHFEVRDVPHHPPPPHHPAHHHHHHHHHHHTHRSSFY